MLKSKKSNRFGGFPARCAGCLLAFILALVPCFNAFAFSFSSQTSYDFTDAPPDMSTYYTECQNDNCNLLLLWDINDQRYYMIISYDCRFINQAYPDLLVNNQYVMSNYGSVGYSYSTYFKVYYANEGDTSWTLGTWTTSVNYACYFDTSNMYLMSWYAPYADHTVAQNKYCQDVRYTWDNSTNTQISPLELKCYFDIHGALHYSVDGSLVSGGGSEPEEPDEPEYSGLLGSIIGWLSDIGDFISTFSDNFSDFVSNIGITIWNAIKSPFEAPSGLIYKIGVALDNIGSTIWNAIKSPFQDSQANPPNGGLIWRLWQSLFASPDGALYNLPTKIWNAIKAPFIEGGIVYDTLHNIIDDLISLFVPPQSYWTTYHNNMNTLLTEHFGGLIQAKEVIEGIIGIPDSNNQTVNRSISNSRSPYANTNRNVSGFSVRAVYDDNTRSNNRVERETLISLLDFSEGAASDVIITFPRLRWRPRINGVQQSWITLTETSEYSLDDLMNPFSASINNDLWEYWYMACNAWFVLWGLYRLYSFFNELIGFNDKKGHFDL